MSMSKTTRRAARVPSASISARRPSSATLPPADRSLEPATPAISSPRSTYEGEDRPQAHRPRERKEQQRQRRHRRTHQLCHPWRRPVWREIQRPRLPCSRCFGSRRGHPQTCPRDRVHLCPLEERVVDIKRHGGLAIAPHGWHGFWSRRPFLFLGTHILPFASRSYDFLFHLIDTSFPIPFPA